MVKKLLKVGNTRELKGLQKINPKHLSKLDQTYQQKDTDCLGGYKNRPIFMLSTKELAQNQGKLQTENKAMGEAILCKWKSKESWGSNIQMNFKTLLQETKKDTA